MPYVIYSDQGSFHASRIESEMINPTIQVGSGSIGITAPSAFMSLAAQLPLLATSTATIHVTDTTYFQYIGRICKTTSSIQVVYYLKTALINSTYGEIAVFKGTPGVGAAPSSLTRLGFLDCNNSNQFSHAPGLLVATISLTVPTNPSDDLWLAFASKADTPAQFEALTIDRMGTGLTCTVSGQPSVITSPCTTAAVNSTVSAVAAYAYI